MGLLDDHLQKVQAERSEQDDLQIRANVAIAAQRVEERAAIAAFIPTIQGYAAILEAYAGQCREAGVGVYSKVVEVEFELSTFIFLPNVVRVQNSTLPKEVVPVPAILVCNDQHASSEFEVFYSSSVAYKKVCVGQAAVLIYLDSLFRLTPSLAAQSIVVIPSNVSDIGKVVQLNETGGQKGIERKSVSVDSKVVGELIRNIVHHLDPAIEPDRYDRFQERDVVKWLQAYPHLQLPPDELLYLTKPLVPLTEDERKKELKNHEDRKGRPKSKDEINYILNQRLDFLKKVRQEHVKDRPWTPNVLWEKIVVWVATGGKENFEEYMKWRWEP